MKRTTLVIASCMLATMPLLGEGAADLLRSLPAVKSATPYEISNADCVLIHVKLIHPDILEPAESMKEHGALLKGIRDDITAIGTNLQSRLGISNYYFDGYTPEMADEVNGQIKQGRDLIKEYRDLQRQERELRSEAEKELARFTGSNPPANIDQAQEIRLIKDILARPPASEYDPTIWNCDQVLFLAIVGNMEPRITEDSVAYARALSEVKRRGDDANRQILLYDREHCILKTIATDYADGAVTNPCSLLIMGGMHDFTAAIKDWNATNSFKFSLITVTPKSYQ